MAHVYGFDSHDAFAIGDLEVRPFPVPHDAREPVQFVVTDGAHRLGVLTDIGVITPCVEASLTGCDALVLECNHDLDLLAGSDYPPSLKQRIAGRFGHLHNEASAALLAALDTSRLQHVIAAHLSQQNNTPDKARAALAGALACAADWIGIADQAERLRAGAPSPERTLGDRDGKATGAVQRQGEDGVRHRRSASARHALPRRRVGVRRRQARASSTRRARPTTRSTRT